MEPIAPHVEHALDALDAPGDAPAAPPENPALVHAASEPQTPCTGTKRDGTPCTVTRGLKHGLCATHSGAADHAAAARARAEQAAHRRQAIDQTVQADAVRRKQGLRGAIAARLADRQEEIAALVVDGALDRVDDSGQPRPDLGTLFRAITEALGRPGEAVVEAPVEDEGTLEDLVAAWAALPTHTPPPAD